MHFMLLLNFTITNNGPLPEEIQILDDNMEDAAVRHLLETVVPIHEVPRNSQKAASTWL